MSVLKFGVVLGVGGGLGGGGGLVGGGRAVTIKDLSKLSFLVYKEEVLIGDGGGDGGEKIFLLFKEEEKE